MNYIRLNIADILYRYKNALELFVYILACVICKCHFKGNNLTSKIYYLKYAKYFTFTT